LLEQDNRPDIVISCLPLFPSVDFLQGSKHNHPSGLRGREFFMKLFGVKSPHGPLRGAAAVLLSCWAGFAVAADIHYPQNTSVAFDVHLANGWNADPDVTTNLKLTAPDSSSVISLLLAAQDAPTAAQTPDQFANQALMSGNAAAFTKKEPASISGIAAEAYFSQMPGSNNIPLNITLILIKPLGNYVVTEMIVARAQLNDAEQASLDAMMKGINLTQGK
jgi:hypothetical protein